MQAGIDVETAAAALEREQERVARALGRLEGHERLTPVAHDELVTMGHFPEYARELTWTAGQVAAHLRESAQVFTARVRRLAAREGGVIADFDPFLNAGGWLDRPAAEIVPGLLTAQAELLSTVRHVAPASLDHAATWENGAPVTLQELVAFLPRHQLDHAEQLVAMADGPRLPG